MKPARTHLARSGAAALGVAALLLASPSAHAQWSRELALLPVDVYALTVQGDTLLAGVDQAVWTSVDGGITWNRSIDLPGAATTVEAARVERGFLWVGTLGRGVFRSLDLGASWQAFSQGLAGGLFESHLSITDFETRGDSLFTGTDGAGVFVLDLAAPAAWTKLGANLEANQAGGVTDLARGPGGRILLTAGGNGYVFRNDPGDADWTISFLNNAGVAPGLQPSSVAWTENSWLVAAQSGTYRSAAGVSPWSFLGHGLGGRTDGRLVTGGGRTFVAFNSLGGTTFQFSGDDGQSWQSLESFVVYTYELGLREPTLWAARSDGLWRRDVSTVGAEPAVSLLALRVLGPHPAAGMVRLRFSLPAPGRARLSVFDARGRRVTRLLDETLAAGDHEAVWRRASRDPPGVHFARLDFAGEVRVARLVVHPEADLGPRLDPRR
jgi:hypothetical protein